MGAAAFVAWQATKVESQYADQDLAGPRSRDRDLGSSLVSPVGGRGTGSRTRPRSGGRDLDTEDDALQQAPAMSRGDGQGNRYGYDPVSRHDDPEGDAAFQLAMAQSLETTAQGGGLGDDDEDLLRAIELSKKEASQSRDRSRGLDDGAGVDTWAR